MARKAARAAAMQMEYERMMGGDGGDDTLLGLISFTPDEEDRAYIAARLEGLQARQAQLDEIISRCSVGWPIDRISRVNLAILRLAVLEVLFCDDVPDQVAANEAVLLARRYSLPDDAKYVNGVLGQVIRFRAGAQASPDERPGKRERAGAPRIVSGMAWADAERGQKQKAAQADEPQ